MVRRTNIKFLLESGFWTDCDENLGTFKRFARSDCVVAGHNRGKIGFLTDRCHCRGTPLGVVICLTAAFMIISTRLNGILSTVIAMGMFIASDSASKLAFGYLPIFELVMLRGLSAVICCLLVIIALGQTSSLSKMFNPWAMARGFCEVGANLGFTLAILHLPIGDVTAVIQTAPLIVLLGASLIYGEKLGALRLILIGVGVAGSLLVAQPGAATFSPYILLGFLVAFSAAGRDLITRKVPQDIPSPIVALSVVSMLTIAGAACTVALETPIIPDMKNGLLVFLAGALLVGGHVGVFRAFSLAPARTIAPFLYSLTLWAMLSSIVLFGDIPNLLAIIGVVLIILAGLLVISIDARSTRLAK
jgi:drug/metabolite transporter (DMT)-like permease